MFRKIPIILLILVYNSKMLFSQDHYIPASFLYNEKSDSTKIRALFLATSNLLDAALNSINSLNSLVKKENYRNKISSFNNPSTSEIGFSLESEIQIAIKPLLEKARQTNAKKFSTVISSLISIPAKNQLPLNIFSAGSVFNSLLTLVGNLAANEKKITREDIDLFVETTGKYFVHYEKLNQTNLSFNMKMDQFNIRLEELQFDTREFIIDMLTIFYEDVNRQRLKKSNLEELFLRFLEKDKLDSAINRGAAPGIGRARRYPGDGIKTAKEIVYEIQKLFNEYQNIYSQNYNDIRAILVQTKELGKNINTRQLEQAIRELDELYLQSKEADILNIRINTLHERLKHLVSLEY